MNPREKLILAIVAIALVVLASLTIIKIFPKTYALSGYLSDENGVPVPGASVSVDDLHTTTDENGYYKISGLAEKSYALIIETEKYGTYSVILDIAEDTRHDVVVGVVEFEEFDEISIQIDANGNASYQYVAQMPPSKLANLLKFLTPLVGTDKMGESYIEAIRSSFARYGLEVKDPSCEISMGENFKITLAWETPCIARWENNRWTIILDWVDYQSAAKETIAEEEDLWILIRNIAGMHHIQNVRYKASSKTAFLLPENAKDIYCPLIESSRTTEHGGGTYSETLIYSENIDGRSAILENSLLSINGGEEITVTPEQLLENYPFYTISYDAVPPENSSFARSLDPIRLDLKYGRELDEQYSIYSAGSWYSLSPAQVLYYSAVAIDNYNWDAQFSIGQPISVAAPSTEDGEWELCWKTLPRNVYHELAQIVRDEIEFTSQAPGTIQPPAGFTFPTRKIRFRDALYTFTRVLHSYSKSGDLPSEITFAPVPAGELTWVGKKVLANHAYFLLPDTLVKTDTTRVNGVLSEVYKVGYDNRKFAEELCNWTGTNITYGLSFRPPTSDEVLESRRGQCRDFANVYLALTRTAGIPARRVSGWIISTWQPPTGWEFIVGTTPEGKTIAGHAWTQLYLPEGDWTSVDPTANRFENLGYEIYKQLEQTWMGALAGYETEYGVI